ncbi:MAG TPA: FKBP-type peptidyl-prolyl cis-trans isomerase, partial [Thermoanaerobaculia bacterium]|nr:FKBP-type peptidyl-prolyl cis-trans isomerase [Thermoanaerobaculia bacterium]
MKKVLSLVLLAALAGAAHAQNTTQQPAQGAARPKPESVDDRANYIIGLNLGKSMKQQDVKANVDLILQGLRDGLAGGQALLTDEEMQAAMTAFQQGLMARQQEKMAAAATQNKTEGESFLAANKAKEGVTTTASGLQYQVIKPGSGEPPKPGDRVTVHYTGTLIDGTVFDSSRERGQPATFGVTQVIPGWVEALQLMKPGAQYKLFIPSNLAYGEQGAGGGEIGPNATLIFDVELVSVEKGG